MSPVLAAAREAHYAAIASETAQVGAHTAVSFVKCCCYPRGDDDE